MAEIWGAVIAVGGGLLAGAASGASQAATSKQNNQYSQEDQELNFQRQDWLAQQQRLWQLQDRAYKQQAISGFSKFGVASGITPPNQNAQMAGLDNFDPNKLGSVSPTAAPPLGQLNPGATP